MIDDKELAAILDADPFKSAARYQKAQLAIQFGIYQELRKLNEFLAGGKPEVERQAPDSPEKPKRKK